MNKYSDYTKYLSKIADINHATALLSWDNEVYMPKDGASFRSQQVATLSGIAHELFTSTSFGESLQKLAEDKSLSDKEKTNIHRTLKEYDKSTKFDEAFIIHRSKTVSQAYQSWVTARDENDWTIFAKSLEELVVIKKEESERYDIGDHPYDAMLDLYEPTMTVAKLENLFTEVKEQLLPLINSIKSAKQVEDSFLFTELETDKQWQYGLEILDKMGYDFSKGRQDISQHPFSISFSPMDVRVTTRLKKDDFPMMLWSCIHEGGHALYEQGLPISEYGLPSGTAVSLGIHESQSRLWENNIGRSKTYWKSLYPDLQKRFPSAFGHKSLTEFFQAINKIQTNLIRTKADELHYHFHVMIRYEIERDLMEGTLAVNDLQSRWNDSYESYFGLKPNDDNDGILQDIHWSHGSFGYFPTYSIGSFYAAQFHQQANQDIPDLEHQISEGNTKELLNWLRDNIHQYGHQFEAEELCIRITGRPLSLEPFMKYANSKYESVYNL